MQASIVAIGREMRTRIDNMDKTVIDSMDQSNRQHRAALQEMSSRIDQIATANQHPQRNPRASRVAFAPPPRSTNAPDSSRLNVVSATSASASNRTSRRPSAVGIEALGLSGGL